MVNHAQDPSALVRRGPALTLLAVSAAWGHTCLASRPVPDVGSGALLLALDACSKGEAWESDAAMALVARRDLAAGELTAHSGLCLAVLLPIQDMPCRRGGDHPIHGRG